jgi:hypothetical protein
MEPFQTHDATLPQQGLTHPAGGCPSGPRPTDLGQGGHEGANPHVGQRVASGAEDNASAGTLQPPGVFESAQGEEFHQSGPSGTKILTRSAAFMLFKKHPQKLSHTERFAIISEYFGSNYEVSRDEKAFRPILCAFLSKSQSLYQKCTYKNDFFMKKHSSWLSGTLISGTLISNNQAPITSPKSKRFLSLSTRQQIRSNRKLETVLTNEPQISKIKAFAKSVHVQGKPLSAKALKDFETIIQLCRESDTASSTILEKIKLNPQPYIPVEALGVLIDRNLTVDSYNSLHLNLKNRQLPAFPPYYQVLEAKKSCYPDGILVSEREASVPLQNLLQHTLNRILKLNEEVYMRYREIRQYNDNVKCSFIGNWGFDGSTGQSLYKQTFSDSESDNDNSIFATTFVPLQLVINEKDVI